MARPPHDGLDSRLRPNILTGTAGPSADYRAFSVIPWPRLMRQQPRHLGGRIILMGEHLYEKADATPSAAETEEGWQTPFPLDQIAEQPPQDQPGAMEV